MNAVVPDKSAQDLGQRPFLVIAARKHSEGEKVGDFFEKGKALLTAVKNAAGIVGAYPYLAPVVAVGVFGVQVHFLGGPRDVAVEGASFWQDAFVFVRHAFIKLQEIGCRFKRQSFQRIVLIARQRIFFAFKNNVAVRVAYVKSGGFLLNDLNFIFFCVENIAVPPTHKRDYFGGHFF